MSSVERLPPDGNICLIDADSLLYYEMNKPTFEEAVYGLDTRIEHILEACNTTLYDGYFTSGRCYRYGVDPEYKANRKGKSSCKPPIFYAMKEYLVQRYGFWAVKELEADDLVSYYSYSDNRSTIVCSPDKDVLFQCIGMHYNYQKGEFWHTTPEGANKFLWKQVLMGDSTDNIKGLPGVGEKTSDNWLKNRKKDFEGFAIKQYVEKFGMVRGLMEFHKTFRLVYLLKTAEDVMRETGLELPPLDVKQQTPHHYDDLF
jgi:5'-3' exonuclease